MKRIPTMGNDDPSNPTPDSTHSVSMTKLPTLALICLFCQLTHFAHADFYNYTFEGVIPTGASTHSQVADGEIWTASFIIDSDALDSNPDIQFGVFDGAVVSGSLSFSGGYVAATTDFGGGTAFVLNDVFSADSVSVRGEFNNNIFVFQSNNETLTTLDSDLLVGPGFAFDAAPDPATFEYNQLTFADEFGEIIYFGNIANNVSFSASAVPEPASVGLLIALALAAAGRRRRK